MSSWHNTYTALSKLLYCFKRYIDANRNFGEILGSRGKKDKIFHGRVTISVMQKSQKILLNIIVLIRIYAKEKPTT